jgi:WD40 repeat protein
VVITACQEATDGTGQVAAGESAPVVRTAYGGAVPPEALARFGKGSLNLVTFSLDGTWIAAGGNVGLYLYDTATLEEIWQLPTVSPIISLEFSPEGSVLAAGAKNGSVSLINAAKGNLLSATPAHDNEDNGVYSMAWSDKSPSSEGILLAVGFNDGNVTISQIEANADTQLDSDLPIQVLGLLDRLSGGVTALAYNPKGNVLATGDRTGTINLWETETFQWIGSLEGHEPAFSVQDLVWSPEGDRLLSSGRDGQNILWDLLAFQPLLEYRGSDEALGVSYSPDANSFATADVSGKVVIWDAADPDDNNTSVTVAEELKNIAWSPSWKKVATVTHDGGLALWSLEKNELDAHPFLALVGHSKQNAAAAAEAWSPDGQKLASGLDDLILVWDVNSGELLKVLAGHASLVNALAWSPDGNLLASASRDESILVWDSNHSEPLLSLLGHSANITDLAWSPDGSELASAGSLDDSAIIWDLEDGTIRKSLAGNGDGIWSVAWSPDGRMLAGGTTSGQILFWDPTDGSSADPVKSLNRHLNWIASLEYSPDGSILASAGGDNRLVLSQLSSEKAKTYSGHSAPVRSVHFSPDGTKMATAGRDGLIIVWDAMEEASTAPLAILEGHTDSANDVVWSPDGETIASASDDGTVLLWEIVP